MTTIRRISTRDVRFPLPAGAGVDATHSDPEYSYACTLLEADGGLTGFGSAFTLGAGNGVVCQLAARLAEPLVGREIEELMAGWGAESRRLADHPQLRWLGPHKGAVHLALAAVANACFDLWARSRGLPLWRLLVELEPERLLALCDLSYVEDALDEERALGILRHAREGRAARLAAAADGYPGYDTSVGWFDYPDAQLVENARRAAGAGFTAMKLKVGSDELARDLRRLELVREAVGESTTLMVDANQRWTWPTAERACRGFAELGVEWIEEPTHPDDVLGHQRLARLAAPVKIAAGEHLPNRVVFKNYLQAEAMQVVQADALRLAGVGEFLTVSLLARAFGQTVIPHVGDMGQLHQHLVLVNHIALGHDQTFLEVIPHLADRFTDPVRVVDGRYRAPEVPGGGLNLGSDV